MTVHQKFMLFAAIRSNDSHTVKTFLATDFCSRLLSAGDLGFHLLRKSIEYDRTEITRLLLDHGCRAGSSSFTRDSPLHLAVAKKRNCRGLVKRLLENGARVDQRNHRNETAVHAAFEASIDSKVVQLLLKEHLKRSLLNETNSDELSYLHIACATSDVECVSKFVERGVADVNAQIKVDCQSPYAGSTPLHMAVELGKFEVVKYLLECGANVYAADLDGTTPIHLALELSKTDAIELLFEYDDARLNCVNKKGLSHFMTACACSSPAIVQDFLFDKSNGNKSLNVNEVVDCGGDEATEYVLKGFTPLHFAAIFGRFDTAKYLLVEGANCCALTHHKITPARFAARNKFYDVVDLIELHCNGYNWYLEYQ